MKDQAIIGVDLGGTHLRAGRIKNGVVTARARRPVPPTDQDEVVVQELIDAVQSLIDIEVTAIGIGVPSVVDVERGIVYAVQNIPSWKEVHLKEKLEHVFRMPVHVNNDANCFALGECHYGKGRGFRHIVGITLGTGLGAGIITDRRLYNGSNCGAGEIGTIPYKDQTVEHYCSGSFFLRECGVGGEVVFQRALAGDGEAIRAFEAFGTEMGYALMIALYAYDPEIVIFGGSVSAAFHLFQRTMMEKAASSFAYQHALQRLVVEASELPDISLLGAAALHLDALEKK